MAKTSAISAWESLFRAQVTVMRSLSAEFPRDADLSLTATLGAKRAELSTHFEFEQGQPPKRQVLKRIKSFRQKIRECRR